jgi:hypothetical protein
VDPKAPPLVRVHFQAASVKIAGKRNIPESGQTFGLVLGVRCARPKAGATTRLPPRLFRRLGFLVLHQCKAPMSSAISIAEIQTLTFKRM